MLVPIWLVQNPAIQDQSPIALPDDSLWLSGPLHREHGFIGDDCAACHVNAFEPVQNKVCTECHEDVSQHLPVGDLPADHVPVDQAQTSRDHASLDHAAGLFLVF